MNTVKIRLILLIFLKSQWIFPYSGYSLFLYNTIKTNSSIANVRNYIKVILHARIDTDYLKCNKHRSDLIDKIFTVSIMIFICNLCRKINKIRKGSMSKYDKEDIKQVMAATYNKRRRK